MSEFHALMALHSLVDIDERVDRRNRFAARYMELLGTISGLSFPTVPEGDRSTYKDFTILVEPEMFGLDAVGLGKALEAEGIATRRYYAPPVHLQRAYRTTAGAARPLPVTGAAAARVLTLPLWSETIDDDLLRVCAAVDRIQRFASRRPSGLVVLPS